MMLLNVIGCLCAWSSLANHVCCGLLSLPKCSANRLLRKHAQLVQAAADNLRNPQACLLYDKFRVTLRQCVYLAKRSTQTLSG